MPARKKDEVCEVDENVMAAQVPDIVIEDENTAPTKNVAVSKTTLADRIPKGLDVGRTVYVRFAKGADVQAERVKAITIRESNVGIVLQSGREINASEVGELVFLKEGDVK